MPTDAESSPQVDLTALRRRLLAWYRRNKRDLPWRRRPDDPYAQWLAEMMLQQTQAATVVPYYEDFLAKFPTVEALAAAKREDVLGHWAGLGYYRRAHHLHEAARVVAIERNGVFPDTVDELLALPGVGRYTAGAIASIAFKRRAPILDGNVSRVLARVFAIQYQPDASEAKRRLWNLAEEILPVRNCDQFNQGLMDLGATVCVPKNPRCGVCPLVNVCRARAMDAVDVIPPPRRRKPPRDVAMTAFIILAGPRILLARCSDGGLWPGMWGLPTIESNGDNHAAGAARVLPPSVFGQIADYESLGAVQHQLTHRTLTFNVVRASSTRARIPRTYRWSLVGDDLPLPRAFHKVLRVHRP
jgi:A/G-specific adenine glycosylase